MRVGIAILADRRWAESERRWRQAEAYGFDHAWTYDHIGWRDLADGPWFDAVATLTAAATVTSTIKLGTFVASPNFRHPVPFARAVTSIDDISNGRLLLGIGAGALGFDATVLGDDVLPARTRADRFEEFATLLDEILRNERTTYRGDHFAAVDARSAPGCVQQPRVPFVIAANGPRTLRLATRLGQGWVTTGAAADDVDTWWQTVAELTKRLDDALAESGRDPRDIDRYVSLDSAPVYSLSSVDAFTDATGRAEELGFTDVITHWPRESSWYAGDEAVLDTVASDVLPTVQQR